LGSYLAKDWAGHWEWTYGDPDGICENGPRGSRRAASVAVDMVVGIATVVLRLPGNTSLKDKRTVVKGIIGRLRNNFNASVAEVGANDNHQRAEIGFAFVGNDRRMINSKIDKALNLVEDLHMGEVIDSDMEIISL
jgi:uncharacterized protein